MFATKEKKQKEKYKIRKARDYLKSQGEKLWNNLKRWYLVRREDESLRIEQRYVKVQTYFLTARIGKLKAWGEATIFFWERIGLVF